MDLHTFQARWTLGTIRSTDAHEAATELLIAGIESPALIELAGLAGASYWEVQPVVERIFAEAGLAPLTPTAARWRLAYDAAARIVDGRFSPLDGAIVLADCCVALEMPVELRSFVYYAADCPQGPGAPTAEVAWFEEDIRRAASELLSAAS